MVKAAVSKKSVSAASAGKKKQTDSPIQEPAGAKNPNASGLKQSTIPGCVNLRPLTTGDFAEQSQLHGKTSTGRQKKVAEVRKKAQDSKSEKSGKAKQVEASTPEESDGVDDVDQEEIEDDSGHMFYSNDQQKKSVKSSSTNKRGKSSDKKRQSVGSGGEPESESDAEEGGGSDAEKHVRKKAKSSSQKKEVKSSKEKKGAGGDGVGEESSSETESDVDEDVMSKHRKMSGAEKDRRSKEFKKLISTASRTLLGLQRLFDDVLPGGISKPKKDGKNLAHEKVIRYVASLVPWVVKGNLTAKELKPPCTKVFDQILSIAMNAVDTLSDSMSKEDAKSLRNKSLRRLLGETQSGQFGYKIYKAVRNRTDQLLRTFCNTFDKFFTSRMNDTTIFHNMDWGGTLPSSSSDATQTKSLHWGGREPAEDEGLEMNLDRGFVMYTFLGGWYKAFGIAGDSLPELGTSIFGDGMEGSQGMEGCLRDLAADSTGPTTESIQKTPTDKPRLGWRGRFFQEKNFLRTYIHGKTERSRLNKPECRPHHGPLYWCVVYLLLSESGVSAGLSEFVVKRDGEPEVEVLDDEGGVRKVSLFRAEAMRWLDLCVALVFTGSLEEVTRIGILAWLESDTYRDQCAQQVEEWGETLWSLWKAQSHGGMSSSDLFNKVPPEVAALDCWKAWEHADAEYKDREVKDPDHESPRGNSDT